MTSNFEYERIDYAWNLQGEIATKEIPKRTVKDPYKVGDILYFTTRRRDILIVKLLDVYEGDYDTLYTMQLDSNPNIILTSRHHACELYTDLKIAKLVILNSDKYFWRGAVAAWAPIFGIVRLSANGKAIPSDDIIAPLNRYNVREYAIYRVTEAKNLKVWIEDITAFPAKDAHGSMIVEFMFVLRDRHGFVHSVSSLEMKMMPFIECLETACS